MEIWKDVKGYEGFYQISDMGKINSLGRWQKSSHNSKQFYKGGILKGSLDKDGYNKVTLVNKDGKLKSFRVHRLVAIHFIENPLNKSTVNHKDGNKLNNNVFNLEWNTTSEQNSHAYKIGLNSRKGIKNNMVKLTEKEVLEIRELCKVQTCTEIAKIYNTSSATIINIKNKKSWKHI